MRMMSTKNRVDDLVSGLGTKYIYVMHLEFGEPYQPCCVGAECTPR